MRIGNIVIATGDDLQKMHAAALAVLEKVGMRVTHDTFLDRLESYGAKVSRADRIVRMPAKVVEKAVAAMKKVSTAKPASTGPFPDAFSVSLGDGCFFLYDHESKTRRKATKEDYITTVRFADALPEVTSFAAPVEIGGVPVPMMVLQMQALAYLHSSKPSSVENNIPEQLKYLVELQKVVADYRKITVGAGAGLGVTSPLTWGDRASDLFLTGCDLGWIGGGCYTMAIAGVNAPVTVEGCATQAAAEILGAWVCLMAVDSTVPIGTLVLTGTADMRTGKACWSTPGAIRQNCLVNAMLTDVVGVPTSMTWTWYTDAVVPGYQCAIDHALKILAMAPQFGATGFHLGDLDGAAVFSLEQALIDLDVYRAIYELYKPAKFDDDTLAVEEIERIGLGHGKTHLDTDYTMARFRDALWMPDLIPHVYWKEGLTGVSEADVVDAAHARWKRIVAEHEPYRAPDGMAAGIEKVLERARAELL